ncbi:hypothetical protein CR513_20174, partial [Mucuna pruriens]
MEEIHARAEKHVEMEECRFERREEEPTNVDGQPKHAREAPTPANDRTLHNNRQIQSRGYEVPPQFTPLKEKKDRIMREICHTRLLSFPQARGNKMMGKNRQDWCDFHRAYGHSTEDCWTLGAQIEDLIQEKTKYREKPSGANVDRARGQNDRSRSPWPAPSQYRGTIATISGGGRSCCHQNEERRQDVYQSCEVWDVLTGANLTPLGKRRIGPPIISQDQDMGRMTASRDEPMVI